MFRFGLLVLCLVSAAVGKPADVPVDQLAQNEFAAYDADGDGVLTKAELKACFSKEESSIYDTDVEGDWDTEMGFLDTDGDGCISDSELDSNIGTIVSLAVGYIFQDLDTDGDGNVDLGEVYPAGSEIGYIDANSDGVVDSGEQQAILAAIKTAGHYGVDDAIKEELHLLRDANGCVPVSSMDSQTKKAILEFGAGVYFDAIDKDEDGSVTLQEVTTGATNLESDLL